VVIHKLIHLLYFVNIILTYNDADLYRKVMDVFNKIIKSVCEKLDAKLRDK